MDTSVEDDQRGATCTSAVLSDSLVEPRARRILLRNASARLNSTLTTDHASALQRVWSITRRTRLMRSQGCQRGASASFISLRPAWVPGVGDLSCHLCYTLWSELC